MCRVATGAGFSTRTLFTDTDETLFQVCRPQLVNGIPDLAQAGDLIDRATVVELPQRLPGEIGSEDELWARFEADVPEILGALLDAVSTALRRLPAVELRERPRLVDFARWVEAAAPALGWKKGEFLDAYLENRNRAARIAVEADPVAAVVLRWVERGKSVLGPSRRPARAPERGRAGRRATRAGVAEDGPPPEQPVAARRPGPASRRARGRIHAPRARAHDQAGERAESSVISVISVRRRCQRQVA